MQVTFDVDIQRDRDRALDHIIEADFDEVMERESPPQHLVGQAAPEILMLAERYVGSLKEVCR